MLHSRTGHKWVFVVVPVIVIGLATWAWFGFIKYHIIPRNFGVVVPGHIYRSGQISASLIKKTLAKYNIRIIVDLASNISRCPRQTSRETGCSRAEH